MGLKIRLSRGGAKKWPFYRIVVADTRSPRDGRFIERLGTYNPMLGKDSDGRIVLKEERIKYWLSQGAKPSDRVARFLGQADIIKMPERNKQTKQHLPRAKTLERIKEREESAGSVTEQTSSDASAADLSAEEHPVDTTPAEEGSVKEEKATTDEAPREDASSDAPAVDFPAEEPPMDDKPSEGRSAEEEKSAAEKSTAEENSADSGLSEDVPREVPVEGSENKE